MTAAILVDDSTVAVPFSEAVNAAIELVPEAARLLEAGKQTEALESLRAAKDELNQDVDRIRGLITAAKTAKRKAVLKGEPINLIDDELAELEVELAEATRTLPNEQIGTISHGIFSLDLLEV